MAETERRSYELLRLTRLKYPDSLYTFIDLRFFQRGWDDDSGNEVYNPTKKGVQIKEDQFQHLIGKWTLVPSLLFHSLIIKNDYPAMRREEFDTAVFRVFKAVEIRVRELSGLPADLIGTALMRKDFDVDSGALTDLKALRAERRHVSPISGAIGCHKNPHSHRNVELSFSKTFEMLLVASHLLQLLDRAAKKTVL